MVKGGGSSMKIPLAASLSLACLFAVTGCAVVDKFGDRAVSYNIQAAQARNQFLLLNIIRSAYRKPLQFSVLTTVTGTATVSGALGGVVPFGGPASGYSINSSSSTVSGGPTFTVANQVDKEFYQGILTPVAMQTVDWYVQAGYPKQLLLTLFVSRISYRRADEPLGMLHTIINQPNAGYADFQALVDELINEGITTESVESKSEIGPALTGAEAAHIDGVSKLKTAGLDLDKSKTDAKTPYQISKTKTGYRFCFDPARKEAAATTELHHQLVARIGEAAIETHACGYEKSDDDKPACAKNQKPTPHKPCATSDDAKRVAALEFTIRGTLGIIYYLGEIARGDLRLDPDDPRGAGFVRPYLTFHGPNADETDVLFELRPAKGDPDLTVAYQDADYSVAAGPSVRDHSSDVLDLVEELAALNSSAKDLPSSSVVNLVGH
jgi:hypothetical protein